MRLLDRYLLRELLVPFGYCLSGFLIFWISFDLFVKLGDFERLKLTRVEILHYYLVETPGQMDIVLPVSLLMALLYALTNHAKHNELTAMRAAGVGVWRLSLPYLAVGLAFSAGLFALDELWVPQSVEAADQILNSHQTNQPRAGAQAWETKLGFSNTRENREWLIEAYNLVTHEMIRPHVEWTLATGGRIVLSAERAAHLEGIWVFTNVQEFVFPVTRGALPSVQETNLLAMPEFSETPEAIKSEIKVSKINGLKEIKRAQLSIKEILDYKRLHRDNSSKGAMLDTKLHGRLAAPWTCLVVVLIALPFGAASGRRNVFVGVASSILICFTYFVLLQLTLVLGGGGLWPWMAAWAPNFIFAAGGVLLTHLIR